jgi:hypothetical protein
MQLTEIIRKASAIREDTAIQFFIAENDFDYKGLPILKDALIYYNGKNEIIVNTAIFGIFKKSNYPELINDMLPESNFNYIVDKNTNCECAINELNSGKMGLWHEDHFDEWSGSYSKFTDRISLAPTLVYNGIKFSSISYIFNTQNNTLTHFINVEPVELEVNNKKIFLPELLEISKIENGGFNITPIKETINYFNFNLRSFLLLTKEGDLFGESADEFEAHVFRNGKNEKIFIYKGTGLSISSDGNAFIRINIKMIKIEKL